MSIIDDFKPLDAIDGLLSFKLSPEVFEGAHERFAVISQSIAEISSAFVETHNIKTNAEIKLSYIAAKRDVILAEEVELSPGALKVHDRNTAKNNIDSNVVPINKYHPPVIQTDLSKIAIVDEPERVKEARRLYEEALGRQRPENNVVELFRNRDIDDEQPPLAI